MQHKTKCGYCAIVGPTNAGKSTLMNRIIGKKISITSRKVQTTRCRITGVHTTDDSQIVFVDTPGLFDAKKPLERAMIEEIWSVLHDVEMIVLVIDALVEKSPPNFTALDRVIAKRRADQPFLLVFNKCDAVKDKAKLLALAAAYNEHHSFDATFMIAGEKGDGVDALIAGIQQRLPDSPFFYPDDQVTDMSERLMAAEVTREHLFDRLHQELPYQMMVETTGIETDDDGVMIVNQNIIVARENHRGIVVGKKGESLKAIGTAARRDLRTLFETPVRLFLHVVVDENWDRNAERLRASGLSRV